MQSIDLKEGGPEPFVERKGLQSSLFHTKYNEIFFDFYDDRETSYEDFRSLPHLLPLLFLQILSEYG